MSTATPSDLSILACQIDIPVTNSASERDNHLLSAAELVSDCLAGHTVDLVALPELTSIDYSSASFSRLSELAEPADGVSFRTWQSVAKRHRVAIAYSFARRTDNGFRISLAMCDRNGELCGIYDKIYLAQFGASAEKNYFEPGRKTVLFELNGWKIAPIICADIRIPELCRSLTINQQADLILHSGAYYRDESFHSWHAFATTRALENQLYLLSVNRAGQNYGDSILVPPWVDEQHAATKFAPHRQDLKILTLDYNAIVHARAHYPFLADRREH